MDPKESGAAGEDSAKHGQSAKLPLAPRKAAIPSCSGDVAEPERPLPSPTNEPIWKRRNRIRPKSPRVPFDHPFKITGPSEIPQKATSSPRHGAKRGVLAFFLSRRKGRSRVLNFILLPVALLLAFLAIFFLFRFH